MKATIDVDDYRQLGPSARAQFDQWLMAAIGEPLSTALPYEVTLGEGEIVVRRFAHPFRVDPTTGDPVRLVSTHDAPLPPVWPR